MCVLYVRGARLQAAGCSLQPSLNITFAFKARMREVVACLLLASALSGSRAADMTSLREDGSRASFRRTP